jgi:hypothetical protein
MCDDEKSTRKKSCQQIANQESTMPIAQHVSGHFQWMCDDEKSTRKKSCQPIANQESTMPIAQYVSA